MTQPDAGPDPSMIDWTRLVQLREEVGQEDFLEVAELFLDEVSADLASLDPDGSGADLQARLHALKGSALNLGFTHFADLCQKNEEIAGENGFDSRCLQALRSSFAGCKASFDAGMRRAGVV